MIDLNRSRCTVERWTVILAPLPPAIVAYVTLTNILESLAQKQLSSDDRCSATNRPARPTKREPTMTESTDRQARTVIAILSELSKVHPYGLAGRASTCGPDSAESPGAAFLRSVRDDTLEAISDYLADDPTADLDRIDDDGRLHEVADTAVPVYTAERWAIFTDLGAWERDISDYGVSDDMTTACGIALYDIALQLASELVTEVAGAIAYENELAAHDDDEPWPAG